MTAENERSVAEEPLTVDVADAAQELGVSVVTLHRAITDGQFPAVRVRGCVRVPRQAAKLMVATALQQWRQVDSAEFCGVPEDIR